MGDAKLLSVWDELLLKDDFDDDEDEWSAAVDQAITELEETPEA